MIDRNIPEVMLLLQASVGRVGLLKTLEIVKDADKMEKDLEWLRHQQLIAEKNYNTE